MKGRPKSQKPPIVVVYKKPSGKKPHMEVFEDHEIDDIINSRKNNPPIPHTYEILEVGVGRGFIDLYKKQHNIKKIKVN